MVVERPADCRVGVGHHEGDGEDGAAVGGDGDGSEQIAEQPRHLRPHHVADGGGKIENEEEQVGHQRVGHQLVASLPTQGAGQGDARQEDGVGYQGGRGEDHGGDDEVVQV